MVGLHSRLRPQLLHNSFGYPSIRRPRIAYRRASRDSNVFPAYGLHVATRQLECR